MQVDGIHDDSNQMLSDSDESVVSVSEQQSQSKDDLVSVFKSF